MELTSRARKINRRALRTKKLPLNVRMAEMKIRANSKVRIICSKELTNLLVTFLAFKSPLTFIHYGFIRFINDNFIITKKSIILPTFLLKIIKFMPNNL
jgi:hypothetical protein